MQSDAKSVPDYLNSLPAERKKIMMDLRKAVKQNLPAGFEETMQYGMISYVVPLKTFPKGYHTTPGTPLPFMSIASQKNHIAVYHMGLYEGELLDWFTEEWKSYTEKKLDMGKCCIRFKSPAHVPVDLVGALASKITPKQWISMYEQSLKK
jgi:hypothetical protein